jgi:hypothetical protein
VSSPNPSSDALDPLQERIEVLKQEFLATRTDRQRMESLKQRLNLLKEWLSLSKRRLEAISAGREPALNPLLDVMPRTAKTTEAPAEGADSAEPATDGEFVHLWVRLLTSVEVDGVQFPAGVIVQVPATRADELVETGAAALVTPENFSAPTRAAEAGDVVTEAETEEQDADESEEAATVALVADEPAAAEMTPS